MLYVLRKCTAIMPTEAVNALRIEKMHGNNANQIKTCVFCIPVTYLQLEHASRIRQSCQGMLCATIHFCEHTANKPSAVLYIYEHGIAAT